MRCTADAGMVAELDFVRALQRRGGDLDACEGPLLRLSFSAYSLCVLEDALLSEVADELLWAGFHPDFCEAMDFTLCAAHWLDLACLVWLRALQHRRGDWYTQADRMTLDACAAAGWDPKEIVNMFSWQQVRLT